MLRVGTKRFEIVIAQGDCVVLRGTEKGVTQAKQDLWTIDKRELTPDAQQIVEAWKEVAYQ